MIQCADYIVKTVPDVEEILKDLVETTELPVREIAELLKTHNLKARFSR